MSDREVLPVETISGLDACIAAVGKQRDLTAFEHLLIATARAGLEDQERLEWIVAHLYYGSLELEVEPGRQSRLCVLTDDSDRDKIASDWRERIDAFRIRKRESDG